MLNEVGKFTVERIVMSARSGKNERTGKALPILSRSYQAMRLGLVKFRTSKSGAVIPIQEADESLQTVDKQFFEPTRKRSNVTFTGQLLESLNYKVGKKSLFILFNPDTRSDGETNSKVYDFLKKIDRGYDFIGLGKVARRRVRKLVLDQFRRDLRKN